MVSVALILQGGGGGFFFDQNQLFKVLQPVRRVKYVSLQNQKLIAKIGPSASIVYEFLVFLKDVM